jgi:hypothetical protein
LCVGALDMIALLQQNCQLFDLTRAGRTAR